MNQKTIVVHGQGGHGRVVTSAALLNGYKVKPTDLSWHTEPDYTERCIIAIGDNGTRKKYDRANLITIIHPTAFVDASVEICPGSFIGPLAVVHVGARVGRGGIVNTGAIIDHDAVIGDWTHVAPGAVLCGTVTLGEGVFVGANATIRENLTIAPWTIIGGGAMVISDITEPGMYLGVPAVLKVGV